MYSETSVSYALMIPNRKTRLKKQKNTGLNCECSLFL